MWHASIFALLSYVVAQGSEVEFSQLSSEYNDHYPDLAANETFRGPEDSRAYRVGVAVEYVNLGSCPNWKKYAGEFYGNLVVNTVGYRENKRVHKISIANQIKNALSYTVSSTSGISKPTEDDTFYHTWEFVSMMIFGRDIRTTRPPVLNLNIWYGMPQIFVPLYLASDAGDAYMLHIYPESGMLGDPRFGQWTEGVFWGWNDDLAPLFNLRIDIASLIENIQDFEVVNYQDFFDSWGNIYRDRAQSEMVSYGDFLQYSLQPTKSGAPTEWPCNSAPLDLSMSWGALRALLERDFSWL